MSYRCFPTEPVVLVRPGWLVDRCIIHHLSVTAARGPWIIHTPRAHAPSNLAPLVGGDSSLELERQRLDSLDCSHSSRPCSQEEGKGYNHSAARPAGLVEAVGTLCSAAHRISSPQPFFANTTHDAILPNSPSRALRSRARVLDDEHSRTNSPEPFGGRRRLLHARGGVAP